MSISVSYAYISSSVGKSSSKTDIYGKTECIDVDVTSEVPELTYKYPIEDNFAVGNVKPVKITLHNTCEEEQSPLNYSVIITTFADSQTSNTYIPTSKIKTKITIRNSETTSYVNMFNGAAVLSGAEIKVNYISATSDLVDKMLETKSPNSNVKKGELVSQ